MLCADLARVRLSLIIPCHQKRPHPFFSHLGRVLWGSTIFSWLGWLGFFRVLLGKKPFSVGLVDQLFQPASNKV